MEHQLRKDRGRIHKNGEMDRRGLCIIPSSHFGPLNWFISSASLLRRKFEKIRQGFPKRSLLMEKSALLCVVLRFTRIYKDRPMTPYLVVHIYSLCFCCGSYSVMENPSNPWHNLVMISPFFWCLSALAVWFARPASGRTTVAAAAAEATRADALDNKNSKSKAAPYISPIVPIYYVIHWSDEHQWEV